MLVGQEIVQKEDRNFLPQMQIKICSKENMYINKTCPTEIIKHMELSVQEYN